MKGKDYPRYEFINFSSDIIRLFCGTCDRLGLHYTFKSSGQAVFISRRADVAFLDAHIGPKS